MKGKRVLVTGASSGIGRATSELLLRRGATLALVGRRKSALADVISAAPRSAAMPSPQTCRTKSRAMRRAISRSTRWTRRVSQRGGHPEKRAPR